MLHLHNYRDNLRRGVNKAPSTIERKGRRGSGRDIGTFGGRRRTVIPRPAAAISIPEDILRVESVDMQIEWNTETHRTRKYEYTFQEPKRLVIRRGQEFLLKLKCNRPFDPERDSIFFEFSYGPKPAIESMSKILLQVQDPGTTLDWKWGAKVELVEDSTLTICVKPSVKAPVGEWEFRIHAGHKGFVGNDSYMVYKHPTFVFIVFNAWCTDDSVYMEDEKLREEYVLADAGAVWQSSSCLPWNFGQFEDVTLAATLVALREGEHLSDFERSDPICVVRHLTAAINKTILEGNWSGDYSGGVAPWKWTGSMEILEKHLENFEKTCYGQCWVFSAVLVSLLRTLGIPCRSVTNISSAHDTDQTLTIDKVYFKTGDGEFEEDFSESIWNFHVWNEAWFKRPDLPEGYDGWQACDATPQEMSEGRFQCGPMSVKAIRQGALRLNYDGWFICGEVNADVVRWYYEEDETTPTGERLIRVDVDKKVVGKRVLTSEVGNFKKAEDLTLNYKPKEGSEAERAIIKKGVAAVAGEKEDVMKLFKKGGDELDDVIFELRDIKQVSFGEPVDTELVLFNTADDVRHVHVHMALLILEYTGAVHEKVHFINEVVTLEKGEETWVPFEVASGMFEKNVKQHSEMCIEATAVVKETNQVYCHRDIVGIQKPPLSVQGSAVMRVKEPSPVTVSFANYTNQDLSNCTLKVESCGSTVCEAATLNCPKELRSGGRFEVTYTIVPRRPGKMDIVALFNSDQLANIRGSHGYEVLE